MTAGRGWRIPDHGEGLFVGVVGVVVYLEGVVVVLLWLLFLLVLVVIDQL